LRESYYLSENQIKEGINLCIKNVTRLLKDSEMLCNNEGDEITAFSIYNDALEEFGKAIILEKTLENKSNGSKTYAISIKLCGDDSESRNEKFVEAFDKLPDECDVDRQMELLMYSDKLDWDDTVGAWRMPPIMERYYYENDRQDVEQEIERDDEEVYPDKLLIAIDNFRNYIENINGID